MGNLRGSGRAVLAALALAACARPEPPNLVLVTLDTTRADHLGAYGYANARTPVLDAFAESARLYENAYATSSWTLPSHASIFTGLLPMQHGAGNAESSRARESAIAYRTLSDEFETLAERLRAAGYRTVGVVGGPALAGELGVGQGFEVYLDDLVGKERIGGRRADAVADRAIAYVRHLGEEPFFLFVNFFDPHAPYWPPRPFNRGLERANLWQTGREVLTGFDAAPDGRPSHGPEAAQREALDALRAAYDAEIAFMDYHLGRLLEALEAGPRADRTLVAITADHGESFGEHSFLTHGHLYEDNVRVPLMLRLPGGEGAGERIATPVQNHGLFGTLLAAAGVALPRSTPGRALDGSTQPVVTEIRRSVMRGKMFGRKLDWDVRAIYAQPYKLVSWSTGRVELFDLERDAAELENLASREPERARTLARRLEELVASHPPLFRVEDDVELRPQTEEALRALGYID